MPIATVNNSAPRTPSSRATASSSRSRRSRTLPPARSMDASSFGATISRTASNALVRRGFDRLAGKTEDGAFYLTQAMGGGKTHSLIAFGLLASDPGLAPGGRPEHRQRQRFRRAPRSSFSTAIRTRRPCLWGYHRRKTRTRRRHGAVLAQRREDAGRRRMGRRARRRSLS